MRRERASGWHVLTQTAIQLAGVFGILVLALLASGDSGGNSSPDRPKASVGDSATLGVVAGETTVLSENYPVEFSVLPADGIGAVTCEDGYPETDVFFFVNPPNGGIIEIAPEGAPSFFVGTDHGPLKNGSYQWRGTPFSGFAAQGPVYGSFTLNAVCGNEGAGSGSVTGSTMGTSTVSPVALPPPEIYVNGIKVSSGAIVDGDVLLTFAGRDIQQAAFVVNDEHGARRILGSSDGVIENPPGVWSVALPFSLASGTQKISVRAVTKSGTSVESPGVVIDIKKQQSQENATAGTEDNNVQIGFLPIAATPLPPRPQLKFFSDEKPLDIMRPIEARVLEFRVIAPLAEEVRLFMSVNGKQQEIGKATRDDLLSLPGTDVWSYLWERGAHDAVAEQMQVFARVRYADGRIAETSPAMLSFVPRPPSITATEGTIATSVTVDARTEEEQILARVTDPGLCTNAKDCRIFCQHIERSGDGDERFRCGDFARTERPGVGGRESLASGVSRERIALILADPTRRPKWLPEQISSAELFERYCADPSHAADCKRFLVGFDLASPETLHEKEQTLVLQAEEEKAVFDQRVGARIFLDTDSDGVSDYDEINIYHTDPFDHDTDGDSVGDGAELLARTHPNGSAAPSKGEEILRSDAFVDGVVASDLLALEGIVMAPIAPNGKESPAVPQTRLIFSGKAPPASYVSIFIYSDPIVVVVKADESGNWTYTLEKELPDGAHTAWTAIVDGGGRIIVKSDPLPFVKTAEAVTVGAEPPGSAAPLSFFRSGSVLTVFALALALIGVLLAVLGLVVSRERVSGSDQPLSHA